MFIYSLLFNMNYKHLLFSFFIFLFGQCVVWVQTNGPLIWPWAKTNKFYLMLLGVPITWAFMEATRFSVSAFGGLFWPGRFLSFVSGILIFTLMTYLFKDEGINIKTAISLVLAFSLILVQLFWK